MDHFPIAGAPVAEGGLLLAYTDNGTPGNVGPANVDVGFGGWLQFPFLFAGRNASGWSRIYAVNDEGQLLSYTDNGTPGNVSDPVVVGFGGWGQFPFLFAGRNALGENRIYAVNHEGQLLSYTDNGTPGNVSDPVVVGASGWLQFVLLFAGANARTANCIYAVNHEGQLLSYTDNGTPGNVGPASVTVGGDGWGQFKFLFAGTNASDENCIYAVNDEGQLLSYQDNGTAGNVSHPVTVGFGAWLEFHSVFAGANASGENCIYTVTQPPPPPPPLPPPPPGPSLLAAVGELPQNPGNFGLRIEGNNFGANETVEVTVDWQVLGEGVPFPQLAQANSAGYFQAWFTGVDPDGICPYQVGEGQPQPPQYFSVSATGTTSHKTASATAGPFTCI